MNLLSTYLQKVYTVESADKELSDTQVGNLYRLVRDYPEYFVKRIIGNPDVYDSRKEYDQNFKATLKKYSTDKLYDEFVDLVGDADELRSLSRRKPAFFQQKVYGENMQGSLVPGATSKEFNTNKGAHPTAITYQLELAGRQIVGQINGKDVNLSIEDFSKRYPEIAKEVLIKMKEDGAARYAPDNNPPVDFKKDPETKNILVATPDQK